MLKEENTKIAIMTNIYLVILISEGTIGSVLTTYIHVVRYPSAYITNVRHEPSINQYNYYKI